MLRNERDHILKLIAAAAAAIARLRGRMGDGAPPLDIVGESRAAQAQLLGKDAALLLMLDPNSAVHALGDPERLAQWVELLRLEAEALKLAGREQDAVAIETRAAALRRGIPA